VTTYFSLGVATALTLLAASLWGSWMQVIKHIKKYPVTGLAFWLYSFSFIFVWLVSIILSPFLLKDGIIETTLANTRPILEIIMGGALMSIGLFISLTVMKQIGLLLSTAISGAVGSMLGIGTSILKEGMPDFPMAVPLIITSTIVFLAAGFLCNYAAQMCSVDKAREKGITLVHSKGPVSLRIIFLMVLNAILTNGWSIGTATGTANKIPPILTCAYMATGSFLSVFIVCGIYFTKKKLWKTVFCVGTSKKPLMYGLISSLCHYGGNMISIYSMPGLTATLSFLYGRSASVWTYFWGLYYKEFSGAKKKTMAVLITGIVLYFVGMALIGIFTLS